MKSWVHVQRYVEKPIVSWKVVPGIECRQEDDRIARPYRDSRGYNWDIPFKFCGLEDGFSNVTVEESGQ
jgi:hypothetical protein